MRFSLPNLPEAHILSDILAAYKRAKEFGNKTGFSMRPTTIFAPSFNPLPNATLRTSWQKPNLPPPSS